VAGSIDEAGTRFHKKNLAVVPMPSRQFTREDTIYLYYEVYNLLRSEDGESRYRVDYHVRGGSPARARKIMGKVGRFLGLSNHGGEIRVSYEHEGFSAAEPMYIALDMDKLDQRRIQIEVEVTDLRRTVDAVARRVVEVRRDD
jgi:hypothetical protein